MSSHEEPGVKINAGEPSSCSDADFDAWMQRCNRDLEESLTYLQAIGELPGTEESLTLLHLGLQNPEQTS